MQAAMSNVSAFGKVPTHGDFVRQNASGRAVRTFEEWLQRGLFHIKSLRQTDLESAYDTSPAMAFLFRGGADLPALAGVMQASRDAAGRRYPLVVAAELSETPSPTISSVIVSLAAYFEAAAELARAGASGSVGHRAVIERAGALPPVSEALNGRVPEDHVQYMSRTTLGSLGEALWTHFEASDKYYLFKNLLDVVAALPEDGSASVAFGLRFPIEEAAPTSSASFWLNVCERLLPASLGGATLLWSMGGGSATWPGEPALLAFFETPPPRILVDVFSGSAVNDAVFDLQDGGGAQAAEVALAIPATLGELLENDTNSLSDFVLMLGARGSMPDRRISSSL